MYIQEVVCTRTKIQRWGNSLGLRIPKSFAEQAGVEAGSTVDLSIAGNELIVRPTRRRFSLRSLVAGIDGHNLHESVDTGEPVGREAW